MFNSFIENVESTFREDIIFDNVVNTKDKIVLSLEEKYDSILIELLILIKNFNNLNLS